MLQKGLHNIRLEINGYGHTYDYRNKDKNSGSYQGGFNVGVQFGIEGGNTPYTRAIYKSDIDYESEDKSKELKAYMTYELKMTNQSSSLITQVNSIVDYFDQNYTIEGYGTKLNDRGTIEDIKTEYVGTPTLVSGTKYNKVGIPVNKKITKEGNSAESIYVTFSLNKQAIMKILNGGENLDNVAEIGSYSIFKDGKAYAGIDKVSNPANATPGNTKTYEGDTSASRGIKLQLTNAPRTLEGKVFLDDKGTNPIIQTGETRQGNGKYDDNEEKGIVGVKVILKEEGTGKTYEVTTNENGDFKIEDYIPGNYTLTYTWGDQTYTVQKYKGTVYNKDRNQDKNWYKEEDPRYTDALDNYDERIGIDQEMKTVKHDTKSALTKTTMNSTTPIMGLGVEKDDNGNDQYGITSIETEYDGDEFIPIGYNVKHIDFGIVERARQQLALTKRVKTLKATLANGQVIANIEIDEKGKIIGDNKNITYMGPNKGNPTNGFVRLELDNELIQGTILEVGYEIKATNESEKDYLSDQYYLYGIQTGEEITIRPSKIIDYLDKNWAIDETKNEGWTIKKIEEIRDSIASNVLQDEESTIADKLILETEKLKDTALKAGESATVDLNVSKILTTTDEISLDNETEVLELARPGGAIPETTPGNYIPGKGHQEADDSMAETTIVTPATGENLNYIIPILMGTSALLILGAGVVLIKKKVLTK